MFGQNGAKAMHLTANTITGKPFYEAMYFIGTGKIRYEKGQKIYEKYL